MESGPPITGSSTAAGPHAWLQLGPPLLGIVALMLFLILGKPPGDGYGWRTLFELGHVPLFGVTALLVLRVVRLLGRGERPEGADYLVALLATAALSLVSEAAQILQPGRDATIGDALKNLTGALCFIAIAASFRPRLWRWLGAGGPAAARLVALISVLALVLTMLPLAGLAYSYGMRRAAVPVLADLGAAWQRPLLSVARSDLERMPAPRGWREQAGEHVARLTFLDAPWPSVTVREPWPDWSGYETLRLQVWSDLDSPVEIALQVDDGHRRRPHRDRYNGSFIVMPGLNDFAVPLSTVARGPRKREMDLTDISQLILLSRRPEEPFQLYFSKIWLE